MNYEQHIKRLETLRQDYDLSWQVEPLEAAITFLPHTSKHSCNTNG